MICPRCEVPQSDEVKYCKTCGANLDAVRRAMTVRDTDEKKDEKKSGAIDWSKTWVAEMLLSQEEQKRRKREQQTPYSAEERRYTEIKAGVITSCVGVAVMIFLFIFMQGLIASGISDKAAAILSRIWIAGIIPFFVGLGLVFNGVIVSRKLVELARREIERRDTGKMVEERENHSLSAADWSVADSPQPSVTENTTRELRERR